MAIYGASRTIFLPARPCLNARCPYATASGTMADALTSWQ